MTEGKTASSPSDWIMRARSLKEKKNFKAAIEECGKGLKAFPKSVDLLFTYGELRVGFYNLEKKSAHLKTALITFEKLLLINPKHYMANSLSAQIYYKGKAWRRAEAKADAVLNTSPNDSKARQIKKAARKAMGQAGQSPKTVSRTEQKPELEIEGTQEISTEKIEGLESAKSEDYKNIIKKLSHFSRLDDIVSIHLIDPAGVEIKSLNKSVKATEAVSSCVADIFRNSGFCTAKMGLGSFQRGQIISGDGHIMIVNVFYAVLAIVTGPKADLNEIEKRVDKYIADLVQ